MNNWYQIRRMRGAAFLILIGILALLNQWRVLSWDKSWPLFLIFFGLMALVERAAWAAGVREQRAAQEFGGATGSGTGTIPPGAPGSSYWSSSAPAAEEEKPFPPSHVPSQGPGPDDSGREDR